MSQRKEHFNEDSSIYSGHMEVETLIDRPVGEVWKQLLDLSSWVTTHVVEVIAGSHDAVGAVVRITPKGLDDPNSPFPKPHHHYGRLIKLVPERQHVMKAYEAPGGSYGLRISAFEDYRLIPVGGKTKVTFDGYIEYRGEAIAKDPNFITVEVSRQAMTTNLANLKRMMESR